MSDTAAVFDSARDETSFEIAIGSWFCDMLEHNLAMRSAWNRTGNLERVRIGGAL